MDIEYRALRLIRHFSPRFFIRFLLNRNIIIRSGDETNYPHEAVKRYSNELNACGESLSDATVMIFGFGGFFGVAAELLRQGARHVFLYDKYAPLDHARNKTLLARYGDYLRVKNDTAIPNSRYMTIVRNEKTDWDNVVSCGQCDIVVSMSVFEHLTDVEADVAALSAATADDGIHVHFIDLRDHFFKYPFEMLCYSDTLWKRFLNPGTNLNRLRLVDYERVFKRYFLNVSCKILEHDHGAFSRVRPRIRPEFLSGNDTVDAATRVVVVATEPIRR